MDKTIKITKLPNKLNENYIVSQRMYINGCICPYCGTAEHTRYSYETWYGTENKKFGLFKEKHEWKKHKWICYTCGAEWESIPFRCDYPNDVIYEEVNMDE